MYGIRNIEKVFFCVFENFYNFFFKKKLEISRLNGVCVIQPAKDNP